MDSIKFHITFTITQKYAVELLISVPVTNIKKQTKIQIICYPEAHVKCKMETSQKRNAVYKTLPMVRSARFIYFH